MSTERIRSAMQKYNSALDAAELLVRNSPFPEQGKMPDEMRRQQQVIVSAWIDFEEAVSEVCSDDTSDVYMEMQNGRQKI